MLVLCTYAPIYLSAVHGGTVPRNMVLIVLLLLVLHCYTPAIVPYAGYVPPRLYVPKRVLSGWYSGIFAPHVPVCGT